MSDIEARRQEWEAWLELWRESGKSAAAWCRENSLPYWKFNYWRRRLDPTSPEEAGQAGAAFTLLSGAEPDGGTGVVLEVGRVRLLVQPGFDPNVLASVVGALAGRA